MKNIPGSIVCDCGHRESDHSEITRGYGRDEQGRTHCYACCLERDLATMRDSAPGDRFSAYVSSDGRRLTSWPGGELGTVELGAPHPWTRRSVFGERRYLRAVDAHGNRWTGTGAPGMYANLRRVK